MAVIFVYLLHLLVFCSIVALQESSERDSDILGTDADRTSNTAAFDSSARDMVSINMYKVYDKYSKELHRQRDINTVRSFKAVPEFSNNKVSFQFNLTFLPESEVILSASFHFLDQRSRHRPWSCRRSRSPSCRVQHLQQLAPAQLVLRGTSPNAAFASHLGNVTLAPHRRGSWQIKDVFAIIKEARGLNELLVSAEFDFGERQQRHQDRFPPYGLPYILVYANDLAIAEPNSVAKSLQRYSPFPIGKERGTRSPNASPNSRVKREAEQIQSNYLPDVQYNDFKNHELWESTYFALKPKPSTKEQGQKQGQESNEGVGKSQVLSFDEQTMKKARRRQWSEPRACSRRYLRVDFADIGWSEWVLAPKAFDAYYCAGTCGFPIPKVVRPSNHATIQSIVRAVGIVPGIPEPCCVPDQMSSLPVLFLDASRNTVLKVYPSMSVETCACR